MQPPSALETYALFLEKSRKPDTGLGPEDMLCAELGSILSVSCSPTTVRRAIESAFTVGVRVAFVESAILHVAAYAGLSPAEIAQEALEAVVSGNPALASQPRLALDEVSADRLVRIDFGFAEYRRFHPTRPEQQAPRFAPLSPDYYPGGMELMSYTFADRELTLRSREIASIASLASLGSCPDQLHFHLGIGLREGITRSQLAGILMLVQVHAGVPRAHNAAVMAARLFSAESPPVA